MSDKIPTGLETERTPEEETLVMRLRVFTNMRWVAIFGVIVVTLIARADIPRLFTDFFRASNVETKGMGLGLSISRRIVEAHGGRIWVESPYPDTNKEVSLVLHCPS